MTKLDKLIKEERELFEQRRIHANKIYNIEREIDRVRAKQRQLETGTRLKLTRA